MDRANLSRGAGIVLLALAALLPLAAATPLSLDAVPAGAESNPGLLRVIVEPSVLGSAAGMKLVYSFVLSAKRSVDITMYELADTAMLRDLIADRKRGVEVRVILDVNREKTRNQLSYEALRHGGVAVEWADSRYEATHQKTITVDDIESLVLTGNLTSRYYTTTRDFGVFDTNRADVAAIEAVFNADFTHRTIAPPPGADLVWSPGSQSTMLAVITGAKHTLSIENEEMGDSTITSAIAAAARRGVRVEVTMTDDSEYDSDWDSIVHAGGRVHLYTDSSSDLYIHAKTTIADAGLGTERIYIGSINFSRASMDDNRELGIVTTDTGVIRSVEKVLAKDFTDCTPATDCESYRP
jgi:phosphatidylserine/phosphatidylglycerophosphate/cardiolipin synthase-like enzyme